MTLYEALNSAFQDPSGWVAQDLPWTAPGTEATGARPPGGLRRDALDRYASRQCERTLTVAVWMATLAGLILGIVHLVLRDWVSAASLLGLAVLGPAVLAANRRFGQRVAGLLLSVLVITTITLNLVDGSGVHDIAIIAYPIFLIFGGLILGKRALGALTAACFLSVGVVAVLELTGRLHVDHPLTGHDLAMVAVLLAITAVVVWVSMDNTERNIERIRRSEAEVRLAYERTLEAWARALEYRDRDTEGHSRRVTELASWLARELGLEEPELTRIRWGALLHDIGKLAIPDRILLKPGPLTVDERDLMRRHPEYALSMLAGIPFLRSVVDIPYYHHERWDGGGYPEGLAGEEIPLPARIFAVVDQWEALSSDRPYRQAWSREEIVSYIQANSGTAFDPRIVQVFLDRLAPRL